MIVSQVIPYQMKFAKYCKIKAISEGILRFSFLDGTGRSHGDYEISNPISSPPKNVINAIREDGVWYWVTEE